MPRQPVHRDLPTAPATRSRRGAAVVLALVLPSLPIGAMASEDLARAKGCLACHSVQAKVVGPAYKDVAARYAGKDGAEDQLVQKVIKGGQGNWGFIPMPPNANVSEAEAHELVKWVLATKP